MADIKFPDKLQCLFRPRRYKVLYGGRGGAKSWAIARALLLIGAGKPLRVLCAREFQKSIVDSVHKLLKDQIVEMGLEAYYEPQVNRIIGRAGTTAEGTEFSFIGLRSNAHAIKSYEGVDVCWVEEAANVSGTSWKLLIPTIRKEGSEIWISFNPEDEDDFTYQEFVVKRRPDSAVVKLTYRDNPWFPDTLRAEMLADKAQDRDRYLHVWEGHCKVKLDGAVYGNEIRDMLEEGRLTDVPWERSIPVHTVWDLGHADATAIWFFQTVAMQTRVVRYFEGSRKPLDYYMSAIQRTPYTLGMHWLPHDAEHKQLGTKLTIREQVAATFGERNVRVLKKFSIADGLAALRAVFPNIWMDQTECKLGFDHLKKYSYKLKPGTAIWSDIPAHDGHSHAADSFRYMAFALGYGRLSEETRAKRESMRAKATQTLSKITNGLGWMS